MKAITIKPVQGDPFLVEIPAGWAHVKSGFTKPGDKSYSIIEGKFEPMDGTHHTKVEYYFAVIRKESNQ